jgi:2-dehydro-3-deoxyphosphogalactonate aldolase
MTRPTEGDTPMFETFLERLPLVAILRGIPPDEAVPVGRALAAIGFSIIEIPMNSPEPLVSIGRMSAALGDDYLIGAGTVTNPAWVPDIAAAGGRIIVMPHADVAVIKAAKAAGLACVPGISTPTEGFAALQAGADALKLFPAEVLGPITLSALRSVFPKETKFLPVGGIKPENLVGYVAAGAAGFGLGSALYRPDMSVGEVNANARAFVDAWRACAEKP